MNLLTTKVMTMIILTVASFLVGLSTIQLRKVLGLHATDVGRKQRVITSFLLCFGAGVLLSTSMLHILPEVEEGLAATQAKMEIEWLGQLVLCAGFFLIYLVEELVHLTLHTTPHREQLHKTLSLRKPKEHVNSECNVDQEDHEKSHNDIELGSTNRQNSLVVPNKTLKALEATQSPGHGHSHLTAGSQMSTLRDFLTILALSFHAIFEGLAVGLEEHKEDVWNLFIAISIHKLVITFCMSLELLQTGPTMLVFFSYLVTFSLVNTFGIGLGMIISDTGSSSEVTVAVLQGLAAGTILYVVMFEILQREKEKEVSGILQLFGLLLGFSSMMVLQIFTHHEHDHEGHEDFGINATFFTL